MLNSFYEDFVTVTEKIQTFTPLVDQFSRTISYLRLSLTDRCNLRCIYCMPKEAEASDRHIKTGKFLSHSDLLSYEELLRVVRLAVRLGMSKIRLTGGEPLVRKGVIDFIHQLNLIDGLQQIRLTSNGVLLGKYADQLYGAGVRHINISLDTLQREKFKKITGKDQLESVLEGIKKAEQLGFKIKINVVAMRGVNDNEIPNFVELALNHSYKVRFIEFMPVGEENSWQKDSFITAQEIQDIVGNNGDLVPFDSQYGDGPARMFDLFSKDGRKGALGFISPISHDFCDKCNRLRLTSEGMLRACLLRDSESDLKKLLRNGASDDELLLAICETIKNKPQGHTIKHDLAAVEKSGCGGKMSRIGG